MMKRRLVLIAVTLCACGPLLSGAPKARYDYYLTGNAADATGETTLGIGLMGGGTDVDALFTWMSARAGGGDFVVIRASGADGYNQYVFDLGDFDSVETLVLQNRSASFDPFVLQTIRNAEALFIAGGDQSNYVDFWKGTPVEDAIHELSAKQIPIAGTSAGTAILTEFVYAALRKSATSAIALADPFDRDITLDRDFLDLPYARPGYRHVFHLYEIETKNPADRNKMLEYLNKNGVDAKTHYSIPIHQQEGFPWGKSARIAGPLANADKNSSSCISLPMFPELTEEEIQYTIQLVRDWPKNR